MKKLQKALNNQGQRIVVNRNQYWSNNGHMYTMYIVKQYVWNEEKEQFITVELFKSSSSVRVVFYLRDLWYQVNGWEVPTDNEKWEKIKERDEERRSNFNGKYRTED
jgi:hypothetical protein